MELEDFILSNVNSQVRLNAIFIAYSVPAL